MAENNWAAIINKVDEAGLPLAQNPPVSPTLLETPEGREATLEAEPSVPAPAPAPQPQASLADRINAIEAPRPSYLSTLSSGLQRGVGQIRAAVPTIRGIAAEISGDEEAAATFAAQAKAIEAESGPQVVESIFDVQSPDDFAYWAVERLGEQAPILLSMAISGGAGGVAANLIGRGLISARAGQIIGAGASNIGLETAGTAQEQREVTGSYQPGISIGAGTVKGVLETYTPFKFLKELKGGSILGAAGRTAGREAITEGLQEQVDILARKYSDPNYSYFSSDMVKRTGESAATGFLVGGGYGSLGQAGAKLTGLDRSSVALQGKILTAEEINALPEPPPPIPEAGFEPGPLSHLRDTIENKQVRSGDVGPEARTPPIFDPIETGVIDQGIGLDWQADLAAKIARNNVLNLEDDNLPRYALVKSDGTLGTRLLTDTDLEEVMALQGNLPTLPRLMQIDMNSLQPGAITAEVWDMPPPGDKRIWFLPGVSNQEQADIGIQHAIAQGQIAALRAERFAVTDPEAIRVKAEALYTPLLDQGMRVVPSRGASFNYNGIIEGTEIEELPKSRRGIQAFEAPRALGPVQSGTILRVPEDSGEARAPRVLALDFNKVPENAYKVNPDGSVEILETIPENAITYGYPRTPVLEQRPSEQFGSATVSVDKRLSGQALKLAEKYVAWWREFLPYLKGLQRKLNVPSVQLIITGDVQLAPYAFSYAWRINSIVINPRLALGPNVIAQDTKEGFLLIILHELGHAIRANSWDKLPIRIKEQVIEGYKRALLNYRITHRTVQAQPALIGIEAPVQVRYQYLSFEEYLAEQFRRWGTAEALALSPAEKFYKSVGRKIEGLYNGFVEKIGLENALELFIPDYTTATWFDYLEGAANNTATPIQLSVLAKRLSLDIKVPPDLQATYKLVLDAVEKWGHLVSTDVDLILSESEPSAIKERGIDEVELTFGYYYEQQKLIKLILGAIAYSEDPTIAERTLIHEAYHSIQSYLEKQEQALLLTLAKRDKVLSNAEIGVYWRWYKAEAIRAGLEGAQQLEYIRYHINNELIARMVETRRNGKDWGSDANTLLDRIIELFERIISLVTGNGFQTVDDVLKAFYRGEFAQRRNAEKMLEQIPNFATEPAIQVGKRTPTRIEAYKDMQVQIFERQEQNEVPEKTYAFVDIKTGQPIGYVITHEEPGIGWDIDMVEMRNRKFFGKGYPNKFFSFIQKDLKTKLLASGTLTQQGYRMLQRISPEQIKNYVFDTKERLWYSPRQLELQIESAKQLTIGESKVFFFKDRIDYLNQLKATIPKQIFKDPDFGKKFSITVAKRRGIVRDAERAQEENESTLLQAINGTPAPTNFEITQSEEAPEHIAIFNIFNWLKAGDKNPANVKYLQGLQDQGDRISRFSKLFFSLQQLAWRNQHIPTLRDYLALMEQFNTRRMEWISRADNTVRDWDKLPDKQREAISELLFWATEMNYRTAAEVRARTIRQPTQLELATEMQRLGMTPEAVTIYEQIRQDFDDFLTSVERVTIKNISRTMLTNPKTAMAAIAEVKADMVELRKKPYFPMARFGEFYISVRNQFMPNNPVVWFSTYATERERDAAISAVAQQHPSLAVKIGKVPENVQEFMGLPASLLKQIRAKLPGVTTDQLEWLEQFESMIAPERSFRKRFLKRKGTPGYSLDALRVFAHYFRSGANYLARIEYKDELEQQIKMTDRSRALLRDDTRRTKILEYMKDHLDYVMTGGNDWAKTKSVISIFQLGASVAAAGMNLTQNTVVTWPYLSNIYGNVAASKAMSHVLQATKQTFGKPPLRSSAAFLKARDEMIAQGKIDVGQAPELGGYAEGSNLVRLAAGTKGQRVWRAFSYYSMWLFQHAERFNRELVFSAAYQLAMQDPNNPHLVGVNGLAVLRIPEINELQSRLGITRQEAIATIAAREAIDRTQFIYQPWARSTFLRSGPASTLLVFFQFTQNMLYALRYNPGKEKMFIFLLTLYGIAGLPGSDDVDKFVKWFSRRFFEKDFSPHEFAREKLYELTKGTVFDTVGPDVLLHGISRYSFGAGFLPDGWGVPRFDASASGSMGNLVPGLAPALSTAAKGGNWKEITAQVASDVAGAGFGQMFAWMQFMDSAPFTADAKKWERIMPRAAKAWSKAARFAYHGADINPKTGETFVKFDMKDPDDIATVLAQAAGFSPTKINKKWEALRASNDLAEWYRYRKGILLLQFDTALRSQDKAALGDMRRAIAAYNKELQDQGLGSLGISSDTLRKSMAARARTRHLREADLPAARGEIPLQKKIFERYGIVNEKKVR